MLRHDSRARSRLMSRRSLNAFDVIVALIPYLSTRGRLAGPVVKLRALGIMGPDTGDVGRPRRRPGIDRSLLRKGFRRTSRIDEGYVGTKDLVRGELENGGLVYAEGLGYWYGAVAGAEREGVTNFGNWDDSCGLVVLDCSSF